MSVPDSDDLATRLAAVERRLQQVEDELALHRQLAGYGPAVDAGDAGAAADLWTEDGLYDIGGHGLLQGRDDLREIVDNPVHRSLLEAGCAHVVTPPRIRIAGDTARGVGYTLVLRGGEDGFEVWRVSANSYVWQRTDRGWRLRRRVNRPLDGGAEARALLAGALEGDD